MNQKKIEKKLLLCLYAFTIVHETTVRVLNMFKQLWNILLQPVMLGYFSFLPDSPFKQEN